MATLDAPSSARAVILRRVARRAVLDAREAWSRVDWDTPTEQSLRELVRTSELAARAIRKVADTVPVHEAKPMIEQAERLEAAREEALDKLARVIEDAKPAE